MTRKEYMTFIAYNLIIAHTNVFIIKPTNKFLISAKVPYKFIRALLARSLIKKVVMNKNFINLFFFLLNMPTLAERPRLRVVCPLKGKPNWLL